MRILIASLFLAACASAPVASLPTPDPVIAAERAFAADAAVRGWVPAFRSALAPDATTLAPDPVNAAEHMARQEDDGFTGLLWRPAYAGIARSGDLGFTTGPVTVTGREGVRGHYFTVWRKQADGTWKWIFDAGCDVNDAAPLPADAPVPTLPVAAAGEGSAGAAIMRVRGFEEDPAAAATNVAGWLAPDARANRAGAAPAIGREAAAALINADGDMRYHALRREASAAGDLVFSFGEARDQHEGAERLRYYARVWQKRPEGWRVVFDEIIPRRG